MDIWSDYSFQWFLVSTIPGWLSWFYVSVLCTRYLEIFMIKNTKFNALGKIFKDEYLWKSGRNQEVMKKNLSEFFFFHICHRLSNKKNSKTNFFRKCYFIFILLAWKVTPGSSQSWKYVLKANFETSFREKPWPAHSYQALSGNFQQERGIMHT